MSTISRRAFMGAGIVAGGGLVAAGAGMMAGILDPTAPWLGVGALWDDPREAATALDSSDVAGDGVSGHAVDLHGRAVVPEDGDDHPSADDIAAMGVGDLSGDASPDWFTVDDSRLRIPAVGMDVPLLAMSAVGGIATPPGFRACYALRNFGTGLQDPTAGAVIVMCHSAVRRTGPGNFLIDVDNGEPVVPARAVIDVAGQPYIFERAEQVRKTELADHERTWADRPGDLVLVTCRQVGGARTTHNTVLFGRLARWQASSGGGRPLMESAQ